MSLRLAKFQTPIKYQTSLTPVVSWITPTAIPGEHPHGVIGLDVAHLFDQRRQILVPRTRASHAGRVEHVTFDFREPLAHDSGTSLVIARTIAMTSLFKFVITSITSAHHPRPARVLSRPTP